MKLIPVKEAWPASFAEFLLIFRVFFRLVAVRVLLPRMKLLSLLKWLTPLRLGAKQNERMLNKAVRYTDGFIRRMPSLRDKKCLPRALTLYHFSRRFGYPALLHCGVCHGEEKELQGHAWLTLYGQTFLERIDPTRTYTITLTYPDSKTFNNTHTPAKQNV